MSKNSVVESIAENVLQLLSQSISGPSFNAYFLGLSIRVEDDCSVSVVAPARHACECIARLYKPEVAEAIRAVYPNLTEVNFGFARSATESSSQLGSLLNVAEHEKGKDGARGGSRDGAEKSPGVLRNDSHLRVKAASAASRAFELKLSPTFRLEHFESGAANKIACAVAQTVVESPGVTYCPLYVYGEHGLGKTHLLQGIALGLQERSPDSRILYTSCEAFANGYIAAIQSRRLDAFRERFRSCDALLIDDIQFLTGKTKTQEELLHTIQFLRGESKQVVLSANLPPAELARIDPRLAAILRSGLAIKLDSPEFELRVRLLHALARRRNWTVEDGAARVLATHIEKNVGELDGALCKMIAVARAMNVQTSSELALDALRDVGILRSGPPTLKDVLDASAKALTIKADAILSSKRVADIVHARHIAMHTAKHLTSHSVAEIGRFFGNRDHSTVLSAIKKITDLQKREENVRVQLQHVRQLLGK